MEMKYKCIGTGPWIQERRWRLAQIIFGRHKVVDGPLCGDIVTVIGHFYDKGEKYLYLLEWPSQDETDGFNARYFAPYDEDHETEWAIEETSNILSKPVVANK